MKKQLSIIILLCISHAILASPQKYTIAVINLKNASDVSSGEAEILSDRLRIELFKTGNVDVMEREQMKTILDEQGFQASGACSDDGCIVEMGQLLGVQRLITGSIGKLGSMYLLNLRVIDVQTAKICKVVSEDIRGGIEHVVKTLSNISLKLTDSKQPDKKTDTTDVKKGVTHEISTTDQNGSEKSKKPKAIDCHNKIFLQSTTFKDELSFVVLPETISEILQDMQEAIKEAVTDEIDSDMEVEILSLDQIVGLSDPCKAGIVRFSLDAYSTRPSASQFIGTAKVSFRFYANPQSNTPLFIITLEENGDRHWGDQIPLENAFEEISDELIDVLSDHDLIDNLDPDNK